MNRRLLFSRLSFFASSFSFLSYSSLFLVWERVTRRQRVNAMIEDEMPATTVSNRYPMDNASASSRSYPSLFWVVKRGPIMIASGDNNGVMKSLSLSSPLLGQIGQEEEEGRAPPPSHHFARWKKTVGAHRRRRQRQGWCTAFALFLKKGNTSCSSSTSSHLNWSL